MHHRANTFQRQAKWRGAHCRLTSNALRLPGHSASLLARAAKGEREVGDLCRSSLENRAALESKWRANGWDPAEDARKVAEWAAMSDADKGVTDAGLRQMGVKKR